MLTAGGAGLCPDAFGEGAGQGLREQPLGTCWGLRSILTCCWQCWGSPGTGSSPRPHGYQHRHCTWHRCGGGDLKHRPHTETQEREGALDPCEGRGGLGGSRLRAMRAGAKPRRVAAAKGGQRGERWARGCPAVPERPGMLPAARREGPCRGPGTAAQVPVSRTPRSLFAFSPLTARWSKGAGVVLLCCRCLCASWQGLPAARGRGCKSERRGFCPRKRRWGAGSGRGQSAGREYLL